MSTQQEELEVLESIYDSDPCFEKLSNTKFQYKFGEDGGYKAFIIEVEWPDNYPEETPLLNLDLFYNKHLSQQFKSSLLDELRQLIVTEVGNPVTYTVFEYIRDNMEMYMNVIVEDRNALDAKNDNSDGKLKKVKKEQLTKSQKRRIMSKLNEKGELPRGHDWVSVIRHLQQMGTQT